MGNQTGYILGDYEKTQENGYTIIRTNEIELKYNNYEGEFVYLGKKYKFNFQNGKIIWPIYYNSSRDLMAKCISSKLIFSI